MNLDPYLTLYTNINLKWIEGHNVKEKMIQFLEDNTGQKLHDPGFDNDLLDTTPNAQATKETLDNWTYVVAGMNMVNITLSEISRSHKHTNHTEDT